MKATRTLAAALLATLSACNPQEYAGSPGVYALALDENAPAFLATEDGAFYFIEQRVEFDIERPTDANLAALAATPAPPFARSPWVGRDDVAVEVDWALTNLTGDPAEVTLTFNGVNEFFEYMPNFVVDDGDVVADFSQWERRLVLEPFETREGTVREQEMDEIAVDLATVVNGAPNANQIVYFENQSDHDPRAEPFIPEVIPGLVGFRAGLQATGTRRLVLEMTVRLRDLDDRLADPDERWELPVPVVFRPVAAEEEQ